MNYMTSCMSQAGSLIAAGRLRLLFQPQYALSTFQMTGAEVRPVFDEADMGRVLTLLEQNGQTFELDAAILNEVCRLQRERSAERWGALPVMVPISMKTVMNPLHIYDLAFTMRSRIPAGSIVLNLTGTTPAPLSDELKKGLQYLHHNEIPVALGDLIGGSSTISSFADIPYCAVRLGTHLIRRAERKTVQRDVLQAMIQDFRLNQIRVIGNVQSPADLDLLQTIGCTECQGAVLAPPMTWREFVYSADPKLPLRK